MSFEKKYLKYKKKYINLKVQLGGDVDVHPKYPYDEEKNYIINASNPIRVLYDFGGYVYQADKIISPSTDGSDDNLYYNGEKEENLENMLSHPYPTIHHSVGTLVHGHRAGIWDFNTMAIIYIVLTTIFHGSSGMVRGFTRRK